jgi:hypothetical protein
LLDLTGANLISYVLRVVKDITARSPRFKNSYGEVNFATNNTLMFGDVQVIVRNISASGNRLSPDYFMYTQIGRALTAKAADKDGCFIEWISEVSNHSSGYTPGVYYMNIDSVNESLRQVGITLAQYQWFEGRLTNAVGSIIYLNSAIDASSVSLFDGASLDVTVNSAVYGSYIVLLSPVTTLVIKNAQGDILTPLTDYWYQRTVSQVLVQSTLGGTQQVTIPNQFATQYTITDQDDYTLRTGVDYSVSGINQITLSQWTPTGSTLTITGTATLDPSTNSPINPENYISFSVAEGQTIAPGQVIVRATAGDYSSLIEVNGQYVLPTLLAPGDWMNWEVRVSCGQFKTFVSKLELNNLWWWTTQPSGNTATPVITEILDGVSVNWIPYRDTNGELVNLVPGIQVAVGDQVIVDDQAAIIVSPHPSQTYEVYGSKELVNFTLDVKANDLMTASELSEIIRRELLITRRTVMEADGVSVQEASRDSQGEQRDSSGTATRYTYSLNISALCDWKMFVPLVTRITAFDITENAELPDYQGKLSAAARVQAFGAQRFLASYMAIPSYS